MEIDGCRLASPSLGPPREAAPAAAGERRQGRSEAALVGVPACGLGIAARLGSRGKLSYRWLVGWLK